MPGTRKKYPKRSPIMLSDNKMTDAEREIGISKKELRRIIRSASFVETIDLAQGLLEEIEG